MESKLILTKRIRVTYYQPVTYEALSEDPYGCTRRHIAAFHKPLAQNSSSLSEGQPVRQWHVFLVKVVPVPNMKRE